MSFDFLICLGYGMCTLIACLLDNCPSSGFCKTRLGLGFYTVRAPLVFIVPPVFGSASPWQFLATSVFSVVSLWVLSAWSTKWCAPGCGRGLNRSKSQPVCYCLLSETLVRFVLWDLFACIFSVTVGIYSALMSASVCFGQFLPVSHKGLQLVESCKVHGDIRFNSGTLAPKFDRLWWHALFVPPST